MKRILSGITPSSAKGLHLGNYFGATKSHLEFQTKGECFYMIANIHSLNTVFNPKEVMANTLNIFTEYLAFGIDPKKTIFFVQSDIPSIPYLQTVLNNAVTLGELKRMHGYKDKLAKNVAQDSINMGLFCYPVLMSSDILLFKPNIIPVGEDQAQHVEICREMGRTFNNRYGNILIIPELYLKKDVARVKGIDGVRKMSKSLGNDIPVFGTEEEIKKQIMSITTDTARIHSSDPGDPQKNVCFDYLQLMEYDKIGLDVMKEKYQKGTVGDVKIKEIVFETFMQYFDKYRSKKKELQKNLDYIHTLRVEGAKKANLTADQTLKEILRAIGLN
ncbi:tryptophan--tRNA ligase [Candidatus Roizmanbacteria bacterium RIFCSPLOWO2_01_FULL_41_22]|uniref:Tryptophan--tRNA ligase n=2 Tax=Candidatus Roizmaniibacteriota TaxID=1752723 RepID=A0A1F7JQQ9_9BACT|nr:MAG: tryptophan--tRNA ligase [Candidatus Roizmanbacteria bacterium RIFCSPLOWO2_01_FULL_41_22]OGK57932.1 MAG: tryptophan--tRNA ligase [Candidatus Roizmanbacteria bacterium RIFCSPLOWO2_02_FULL_41_9]